MNAVVITEIYCDGQIVLMGALDKSHIIKVVASQSYADPLTDTYLESVIKFYTWSFLVKPIMWCSRHCIDPDGQDKLNRLIDRGFGNGKLCKRDSSKLWGWEVLYLVNCIVNFLFKEPDKDIMLRNLEPLDIDGLNDSSAV